MSDQQVEREIDEIKEENKQEENNATHAQDKKSAGSN